MFYGQAHCLTRELPKSGDVPKSPLVTIWQFDAVGGHKFDL